MAAVIEVPASARAGDSPGSPPRDESFVLESRGWSSDAESCAPKIAALASLLQLSEPAAVPAVAYVSRGNLLVIAGDAREKARAAAGELASSLHVTLLERDPAPAPPAGCTAWSGQLESLAGHLGEFTATIAALRTPDASVPAKAPTPARFDLVLDFAAVPAFAMRMPPQGYFRANDDAAAARAVTELRDSVGEFEKPKYFHYREDLCAHSRSEIEGCNACIEICSTQAIRPDGDHVAVDPHLCMGCGACATVCPSGAMGYQFPRPEDRGAQMRQLLGAYRQAGGSDACVVFHNTADARDLLASAAAAGQGLPANALPLAAWHVAAIGLDLLLPAIAYGAARVVVLSTGSEDAEYIAALRGQMAIGEAVLQGLGYDGRHFDLVEAASPEALAGALASEPSRGVEVPGTFALSNDKRTAIEFAVEHLAKHAPRRAEVIALPLGAPFGQVMVDQGRCTMCMSCVGACPASALMDGVDQPLLKFVERNCVQCGLCEATCPEDAITLEPRLLLGPAAREARVLNETQPFHCVSCKKPFGTKQMVETMMTRLAGHSMFGGEAMRRLQMCADCRVVDMMQSKNEVSVLKLGAGS